MGTPLSLQIIHHLPARTSKPASGAAEYQKLVHLFTMEVHRMGTCMEMDVHGEVALSEDGLTLTTTCTHDLLTQVLQGLRHYCERHRWSFESHSTFARGADSCMLTVCCMPDP